MILTFQYPKYILLFSNNNNNVFDSWHYAQPDFIVIFLKSWKLVSLWQSKALLDYGMKALQCVFCDEYGQDQLNVIST